MLITEMRAAIRWIVAKLDVRNERGASAVEYGIMVFLIATVIILAVVLLGERTSTTFSCTAKSVSTKSRVAGCG